MLVCSAWRQPKTQVSRINYARGRAPCSSGGEVGWVVRDEACPAGLAVGPGEGTDVGPDALAGVTVLERRVWLSPWAAMRPEDMGGAAC